MRVNAVDHFPGGSVTKTEDVLIYLTYLTDITVPGFESPPVG